MIKHLWDLRVFIRETATDIAAELLCDFLDASPRFRRLFMRKSYHRDVARMRTDHPELVHAKAFQIESVNNQVPVRVKGLN